MRVRASALVLAVALALFPEPAAASRWGSSSYGDPPGFCPAQSPMWTTTVVTNDPLVGSNPEQDTFWGIHFYPGYDDWYGFWYGDFRGSPGDSSGWRYVTTSLYGQTRHWSFADWGWAVHGHAKQYIAYYNWTFGGQCRMGWRGRTFPPPYMADVYGYPVVDIYVDSVPPYPSQPRVSEVTTTSVSFTWDPVADRGDGAGPDLYTAGLDHYTSWWTASDGRVRDFAATTSPRAVKASGLAAGSVVCVHVQAFDRLANATPESVRCGAPLQPPPIDGLHPDPGVIVANPARLGLTGLETWFALQPAPQPAHLRLQQGPVTYDIVATPQAARWSFGDGFELAAQGSAGFGSLGRSDAVKHTYQAESQVGYDVGCVVDFALTWSATEAGLSFGPYPAGTLTLPARPLTYPVEQAQPELLLSAVESAA